MKKIEGLVAAAFTPFKEDKSIDFEKIPALVDKLVKDGLTGVFVCGSNGEGPNMIREERMEVAEAFLNAARGRLLTIVHVGHSCIAESKILASQAQSIGADAISCVASFYFKPQSVLNLTHCMAEIAKAAPALPFYYYHIPHLTGVAMDMLELLRLAGQMIPNFAGIKYTASSINEYESCLNYENGRFDILYGFDELLLPALSVGAKGAIGSTYTFAAPLYLKTMDLFKKGEVEAAKKNHDLLVEMVRIFVRYPPIPAQKAIMKMTGYDSGPARLPLVSLDGQQYEELESSLTKLGFFELLKK